jgi:hypothetical protein
MKIAFKIVYKNTSDTVMGVSEFIDTYLFGIPLINRQGETLSPSAITTHIQAASEEIEKYLSIKIRKQIIAEERDYMKDDWMSWGYMRTSYPVSAAFELKGFVNTVQQMDIPGAWLSTKSSNDESKFRQIHVVPVSGIGVQYTTIYNGVVPLGFFANNVIPNYWRSVYCTGFTNIPADLMNVIGKLGAINIFHVLGDLILGTPGLSSKSVSIDGLSQSYQTQGSYKQRIDAYLKDLELSLPRLYNYYKGVTVLSM